ncbi:MAG: PAS domain S-box protein [Pirellulales bacterium]|nr:PAS domain S-box protein [Pirellulales bacterium]
MQPDENHQPGPTPIDDARTCAAEPRERNAESSDSTLALFRATIEATSDGILVTDGERKAIDFNHRFAELWQLPLDVQNERDHRRYAQECGQQFADPQSFIARLDEISQTSPPSTFDVLELADGRIFERVSHIIALEGRPAGRVWSLRDVTLQRRLERGQAHLAAIVESSHEAIISLTLDGIITSWNRAAQRIFGYSVAEIVGKSIATLMPIGRASEEAAIIERLKRGEPIDDYQTVRQRKDGTQLHISVTISPIKDARGSIVGASKITRDITGQIAAAEERVKLLEAERAARLEAERINTMKDEFLANLSHELRTPLNSILGWSQLLATGQLSPEETETGIDTILRNARAQTKLIDDLLDMNRILSGKIRLDVQLLNLGSVIEAAVASARPAAEAKGIHLRSILDSSADTVSGDPNRLQQVVWNLLSNSIKFTPKGGAVDVLLQRAGSHLEVVVRDSGQGISADFLPYVYERFRQADSSTTRKHGGLGLGLPIVKQLVELHGGEVRAESAGEGTGATFVVSLPMAPVRSLEHPDHPSTRANGTIVHDKLDLKGIAVLVVDDEPDARELIRQILARCDAETMTAANAADALRLLKSRRPQVVVSDIGMPETDGYAFIRSVRGLPVAEGGKTPAIALTAFARSEDRTRAMIAGYQIHISKPFEPRELLATVASLAGRVA